MKRLFRTSKSPVVDPLPPPSSNPSTANVSGASTPSNHHEHRWPFGHSHQPEVTPFPIDAGRETVNNGVPSQQQQSSGKKGKERGPSGGSKSNIPSLLEIQQIQEREQQSLLRSTQSPQPQSQPLNQNQRGQVQQRNSKGYIGSNSGVPSPDGWTIISPSNKSIPIPSPQSNNLNPNSNGYDPSYDSSLTEPLIIPNASFANSLPSSTNNSPSSASTHTALYLPPGARPATPPSMRPPYQPGSGSARHSQSSLNSMSTAHYGVNIGEAGDILPPNLNSNQGRERGHSIVSNSSISNRSDNDTVNSTSTYTQNNNNIYPNNTSTNLNQPLISPNQPAKLQRPQQSNQVIRSPLVNSYPSPEVTSFPSPHPYTSSNTQPFPPPPPQPAAPPPDQSSNQYNSRNEEIPNTVNLSRRGSQMESGPNLREKKRGFLGMGMNWGKGKDKEKRESNAGLDGSLVTEEPRKSFDNWRNHGSTGESESQPSSTHGHSTNHGHEDEPPRGRLLGLDFGGGDKRKDQNQQPQDVNSAIRSLCSMPDPPPANIYDVCDRIHKSDGIDGITKDAARAIRKEFKHGNEAERRNAAKVWLYLMRNVSNKGFRQQASNKKFLQALEPILLAPATKPLVSQPTYKLLTDILSDLTFSYGQEKGCEGLNDLWRKVKLPQESEIGNPLPLDHPIFSNEPIYNQRSNQAYTQSVPDSRRASSPSLQQLSLQQQNQGLLPPPIQRGPSPGHYGGPGYANLPSHGEDIRRLTDECTAAKESARVLSEALVFTKPDELEHKPIIQEFYRKVFLAHESLTNQMDWAQAEAARSRERHASLTLDGNPNADNTKHDTSEEIALATLLEAHSALGEALKQHDDLSKLAGEEKEMREVRERSKKDTRMDRNQQQMHEQSGLFPPSGQARASSSRSPSPVPQVRLPLDTTPKVTSSPRNYDLPLPPPPSSGTGPTASIPIPGSNNPFRSNQHQNQNVSRTPSPDTHPHNLPQPPKLSSSPGGTRTNSPLGRLRMSGPRPLPNPFASKANNNASHQSLNNLSSIGHGDSHVPSRNDSGDTPSRSGTGDSGSNQSHNNNGLGLAGTGNNDEEVDGDLLPPKPVKPSRKALGKRRAVVDEDNNFDPNDMFNPNPTDPRTRQGPNNNNNTNNDNNENESSEEDYTILINNDNPNNGLQKKKTIIYAYDAYEERQKELKKATQALKISEKYGGGGGGGSGGGGARI